MTAVEYLINELSDIIGPIEATLSGELLLAGAIKRAKEMEKEQKILLVEELKNYTKEAQCILGNDEREASEFVEIFNNTTFKSE